SYHSRYNFLLKAYCVHAHLLSFPTRRSSDLLKRRILMLNQRQEKLLLLLKRFDYLTIKQFQKLHDLKSIRNAYRVIKQLEPYVNVFKDNGTNVYYLNKVGREYVNSSKERTKITTKKSESLQTHTTPQLLILTTNTI